MEQASSCCSVVASVDVDAGALARRRYDRRHDRHHDRRRRHDHRRGCWLLFRGAKILGHIQRRDVWVHVEGRTTAVRAPCLHHRRIQQFGIEIPTPPSREPLEYQMDQQGVLSRNAPSPQIQLLL